MSSKSSVLWVFLGGLCILTGVFCIFTPFSTILSMAYLMAFWMVFSGTSSLVYYFENRDSEGGKWLLVDGLLGTLLGLFIAFNNAESNVNFIILLSAFWAFIKGALGIGFSIELKRYDLPGFYLTLFSSILSIIVGIIFILSPSIAAFAISTIFGLTLIVCGLVSIRIWYGIRHL